ncbi:MAG: RusA family crossover junction endodeoxyribonuclease [Clostridiaceae bacterium]|nr:RusA family crossover junction endodeoxyribonuclease [Clostridiaceae bacterium]
MENYAKVVITGSPISKSNFKLFNLNGRAILPFNSGKYHDRYAVYEEQIAYEARHQNPGLVLTEALIAVLHVYYKSRKRHPDTNNITKSIFDGIEKSGLIINDVQVRRLIIEEFYDSENPRFELELYGESSFYMTYEIFQKKKKEPAIEYSLPPNRKSTAKAISPKTKNITTEGVEICEVCGKHLDKLSRVSANKGTTLLCKECLKKLLR